MSQNLSSAAVMIGALRVIMLLLVSADFFQNKLLKKHFVRNSIRVSNCLHVHVDPDQDRHFVGPGLSLSWSKLFAKIIRQHMSKVTFSKEKLIYSCISIYK